MKIDPMKYMERKKDREYLSRKQVMEILYRNLPPVQGYDDSKFDIKLNSNKYCDWAVKFGLRNYRVGTVTDFYRLELFHSVSKYLRDFINDNGVFLIIFNTLADKPISCVFRSLGGKEFIDLSLFPCPYGLDLFEDSFTYGNTVIVTEGIYDADVLRSLYRNTLAIMTSSVSVMMGEVLGTVSDHFILCFDSDSAGERGKEVSEKRLKRINSHSVVETLPIFSGDKDIGELEDKIFFKKISEDGRKEREDFYRAHLSSLVRKD